MVEDYSRRDMINAGGAGIAIALAGCAGNDSEPNNNPETTQTEEPGYEVAGYEVEDNLEELEDGEELEITAKRVLENQDGDRKTEDLGPDEIEIAEAETIRYHEQVEDSILKEAGLHKNLQNTVEQTDNSYSFSSEDLIAGNNLLTLQIEINDTEYNNTQTYQGTGKLQITKNPEQTLQEVLIEDQDIFDELRDEFRSERYDNDEFRELPQQIEEEINREEYDTDRELSFNISIRWSRDATEIIGNQPSNQASQLAETLEELNSNVLAGQLSNRGHNTVLMINEDTMTAYHTETTGGNTATPPEEAAWPTDNPEETPLMSPKHRISMARSTVYNFMILDNRALDQSRRRLADMSEMKDELAVSFMNNMREDTKTEKILDFAKTAGATMELSPSLDYELSGTFEDETEIKAES